MCAPFWLRLRSTKQSSRARNSSSRIRTTFSTPLTPTRDSPTCTPGRRACTSSPGSPVRDSVEIARVARTAVKRSVPHQPFECTPEDPRNPRRPILVSIGTQLIRATQRNRRLSVGLGRSERLCRCDGETDEYLGGQLSERLEGLVGAADMAVVELEELQETIA